MFPSCAGVPTDDDIKDEFDMDLARLNEAYERLKADCHGDAGCLQKQREWYRTQVAQLQNDRGVAREHHWQDAQDRRKAWEDALRGLIPNWPSLKDLFSKSGVKASIQITSNSLGTAGNGVSTVAWATKLKVQGNTSFTAGLEGSATIEGSFNLEGTTTADGTRSAEVYSGLVVAKVGDPIDPSDMVTLTVVKDSRNRLEIAPSGTGTLTVVVTREISDKIWNALMPYYIQVHLPVTRHADDSISINLLDAKLSQITGRTPFVITDYNGDGVREHDQDLAALMVDFAQHTERADLNSDDAWDQADIDLWENLFALDLDLQ